MEIGASSTESRDIKIKLSYVKYILGEKLNEILKTIFNHEYQNSKNKWITTIKNYLIKLNLNLEQLKNLKLEELKKLIYRRDTQMWEEDLESKETLKYYRIYKAKPY